MVDKPLGELAGVKVLVVDDNAVNRQILTVLMTSWGIRCEEAQDAVTALERLRRAAEEGDPFRIAVLDMLMPEVTGETLGRMVKEDPLIGGTILIMLTSMGNRGDASRLEKSGFSAYMMKPVRRAQLMDCLRRALGVTEKPAASGSQIITRHSLKEDARQQVKILLAEDNPTNQIVALGLLAKYGYRADTVSNGIEAIEAMKKTKYDLVFMDVQMPEMDGISATREVRRGSPGTIDPQVPIIAMTAHALKGDRERCLEAGMSDYIGKPIQIRELAAVLERWLNQSLLSPYGEKQMYLPGARRAGNRNPDLPCFDRQGALQRLGEDEEILERLLEVFIKIPPAT
jgi:CheY-like chemotaxis protein